MFWQRVNDGLQISKQTARVFVLIPLFWHERARVLASPDLIKFVV
jgi:hypothetical protein